MARLPHDRIASLVRSSSSLAIGALLPISALLLVAFPLANGNASETMLGELYNRSAQYHGPERNPVILIPGILGSTLKDQDSDEIVWGGFTRRYANPSTAAGARLFALPTQMGTPLSRLRDRVVATGALSQLHVSILGVPVEMHAYREILLSLGIVGGYADETLGRNGEINYGTNHFTCFQFPYDWRRDLTENAALLHQFILEKRKFVQAELAKRYGAKNVDVHFDLIAHSMGGLVARYYLEYGADPLPDDGSLPPMTWAGARYVNRAIFISPPNAGAMKAIVQLVGGVRFAFFLPKYQPAVLGTLPAVYEMLPHPGHRAVVDAKTGAPVDLFDPKMWEKFQWGLADPRSDSELRKLLPNVSDPAERRAIALDHLGKCLRRAKQFCRAMDAPARPPDGTSMYLMAGDAIQTPDVAAVNPDGSLRITQTAFGDGTVLRSSALLDERTSGHWSPDLRSPIAWEQVSFFFKEHLALTQDVAFTDNLLFILLEKPRR